MSNLSKEQLSALARLGAQARLAELVAEEDAILRAYPDLAGTRRARRGNGAAAPAAPAPATARRPYRMSPAKRKAQSERMRAYWAARRQAKEGQPEAAQASGEAPKRTRARKAAKRRAGK